MHNCFALAYIDGGTGSLLIQALIAGLCGAAYVVKVRFRSIAARVARRGRPDSDRNA